MKTYSPMAGEHIEQAAVALCALAPAVMDFNGVRLTADENTVPNDVIQAFYVGMQEAHTAWAESEAGKEAAAKEKALVEHKQVEVNRLVKELYNIPLQDPFTALSWMAQFAEVADHIGVEVPKDAIIEKFQSSFWAEDDCIGHPKVETDSLIMARWIVGQGLSGIAKLGCPHPVLISFVDKWKAAWANTAT